MSLLQRMMACEFNPLFSFPYLFIKSQSTAILAKVVGKSGSTAGRRDDTRYNIVISQVYKNTEGRNPIASKSKKIQLVVPVAASSCRCPNLESNK